MRRSARLFVALPRIYPGRHVGVELNLIRVLLVDDVKDWRSLVRSLLVTRPEWDIVDEASDGLEAVLKAEELKPDLILLDIGLPKLNGIEAARRIRQVSPGSKIVCLTTDNSVETEQAAVNMGAQGFVHKPRARGALLAAIDAVLQGQQFRSSLEDEKSAHA